MEHVLSWRCESRKVHVDPVVTGLLLVHRVCGKSRRLDWGTTLYRKRAFLCLRMSSGCTLCGFFAGILAALPHWHTHTCMDMHLQPHHYADL